MLIFLATQCYSPISLFHDPTTISAVDRHYVFTSLAYIQEAAGTSSATRSYSHEPFRWIVCPTKARMCDWSIFMSFRDVIRKLCYWQSRLCWYKINNVFLYRHQDYVLWHLKLISNHIRSKTSLLGSGIRHIYISCEITWVWWNT